MNYIQAENNEREKAGYISLGMGYDEERISYFGDVIFPCLMTRKDGDPKSHLFVNPGLKYIEYDDSTEEVKASLGVGYRYLYRDTMIYGVNAFYDLCRSRHRNWFQGLGFGAELMHKWIDLRGNYYLPEKVRKWLRTEEEVSVENEIDRSPWSDPMVENNETVQKREIRNYTRRTTTTTHYYEEPLEGFDLEAGLRLPFPDKRITPYIFGGYYHFEPIDEGVEYEGFKARIEIMMFKRVILDVCYYEKDDLLGVHLLVGAHVRIPIGVTRRYEYIKRNGESSILIPRLGDRIPREPFIYMQPVSDRRVEVEEHEDIYEESRRVEVETDPGDDEEWWKIDDWWGDFYSS